MLKMPEVLTEELVRKGPAAAALVQV